MSLKSAFLHDVNEVVWNRALQDNVRYEASEFIPNGFVSGLNSVFRFVRLTHSNRFADYLSSSNDKQHDYVSGVLLFCYIIAGFSFTWGLVLLILKCRGEGGGCASGNAFKAHPYPESKENWPAWTVVAEDGSVSIRTSGSHKSRNSKESRVQSVQSGFSSKATDSAYLRKRNKTILRRARQTRLCFLLFGIAAFVCVMILLVGSFSKMGQSLENSEVILLKAQDILDGVASSLQNIESSFNSIHASINSTDIEFSSFCPNGSTEVSIFGVDLENIAAGIRQSVGDMDVLMNEDFKSLNRTLERVQNTKNQIEIVLDNTLQYSWTIPLILFTVALVVMISMMGVISAWRGRSGQNFQNFMSYGVLFFMIVFCTLGWVATIGTGVGGMVSVDICTAGGRPGGPDTTIRDIVNHHFTDKNDTLYKLITDYTSGCEMHDPLNRLTVIESNMQTWISLIWKELSNIDEIGRQHFESVCGHPLDGFLSVAYDVTKSFSTIRTSLDNTKNALNCTKINPIYSGVVHDEVCGEIVTGLGVGFVWLLLLSICLMVMLSLRASWLQEIEQSDRSATVYDEGEEVLIHDEYEEYLQYISKYKHEWEVYEGINSGSVEGDSKAESTGSITNVEQVYLSNSSNSESNSASFCDDDSGFASSQAESTIPDDISFLSLQITPSIEAGLGNVAVIPSLLPAASSEEEMDTFEFESLEIVANDNRLSRISKDEDLLSGVASTPAATNTAVSSVIRQAANHLTESARAKNNSNDEVEVELGQFAVSKKSSSDGDSIIMMRESSSDGDSAIMKTMSSFGPSAHGENNEKEIYYGVELRTKESIEAEMDRRFG